MAESARETYNATIIEEFRANEGRVGGPWAGIPLIIVHHVGARSGVERVTPLGCFPQADGRYAIVASNGGAATHPDWYYNLRANPRITVEVDTETVVVLAEELDEAAHAEVWPGLVAQTPQLAEYEARIARPIPVFMLTRQDP
jgi:deazaflavin-dependent oxidoreductase (nitroreductase family)